MSSILPRVLHVTAMYPSAARPAFGVFVESQVRGLAAIGIPQDVLVIKADVGKVQYVKAVLAIRRRVARGDVDVVHAHYGLTGAAAAFQGFPLVVTFAGSDLNGVRRGPLGRRLNALAVTVASQWAARRAGRVIVMSERMRARLWSRRARRASVILPYGVDLSHFVPGDKAAARRQFNLSPDAFIVLWPHNDSPNKRRDLADAAASLAKTRLASVHLWRPPRVPSEMMPLCYQAADCMLMTSDAEGSPTVVKEALSVALPVISVDVGDVWRHIGDIPWCYRVPRNPEAIADAIVRASQDRRILGRPKVVDEFDSKAVAKRLVEVYREAIKQSQTRH